ncbi:MAG: glycosyltransferase [Alphaproteobacteria bacterium]
MMTSPVPVVSVVMTVFNAGPYLRPAIDSLLAQNLTDFEILAIDDGSRDGSAEGLRRISDPRLRVVTLPGNVGRTPALNFGLGLSTGEFIAILDADDLCEPQRLERQVAFLRQRPDVALLATGTLRFDDRAETWDELIPPTEHEAFLASFAAVRNPIVHSSVMMRRSAVFAVGGYPSDFVYAQDFALYLALVRHGYRLAGIPDVLVRYRFHPVNMSASPKYAEIKSREFLTLYGEARRFPNLPPEALRAGEREMVKCMIDYGHFRIAAGHGLWGYGWLLRAFLTHPWHAIGYGQFQVRMIPPVPGLLPLLRNVKRRLVRGG